MLKYTSLFQEGKELAFEMGVLLRKRYNDFLGLYYQPGKDLNKLSLTKDMYALIKYMCMIYIVCTILFVTIFLNFKYVLV